jgi:nitrate reductase gamma subunit
MLIFLVGIGLRLGRWFMAVTTPRRVRGVTRRFEGGADDISILQALKQVIIDPVRRFYSRSNRTWSRGYMLYHMAITTKVVGYSLAGLIVLFHVVLGLAVPDVAAHQAASYNYAPANLLAIVFGNGEALQSNFLFGPLSTAFVSITWVALLFAVAGNVHLLYTAIRNRGGAIRGDIDQAAANIRHGGWKMWDRMAVRSVIFCIIWTELFARLHIFDGIVFVHAFLGLVLLTILPFTYLFHMIYNFLAIGYAVRRRITRTIA